MGFSKKNILKYVIALTFIGLCLYLIKQGTSQFRRDPSLLEGMANASSTYGPIQFILIKTPPRSSEHIIQISQLAVYANRENIAPGKNVLASEPYAAESSKEKAIDGTLEARNYPDIYHSQDSPDAFWELDLGEETTIEKIVYYNRADCCNDRADAMIINLLDSNRNQVGDSITLSAASVQSWEIDAPSSSSTTGDDVPFSYEDNRGTYNPDVELYIFKIDDIHRMMNTFLTTVVSTFTKIEELKIPDASVKFDLMQNTLTMARRFKTANVLEVKVGAGSDALQSKLQLVLSQRIALDDYLDDLYKNLYADFGRFESHDATDLLDSLLALVRKTYDMSFYELQQRAYNLLVRADINLGPEILAYYNFRVNQAYILNYLDLMYSSIDEIIKDGYNSLDVATDGHSYNASDYNNDDDYRRTYRYDDDDNEIEGDGYNNYNNYNSYKYDQDYYVSTYGRTHRRIPPVDDSYTLSFSKDDDDDVDDKKEQLYYIGPAGDTVLVGATKNRKLKRRHKNKRNKSPSLPCPFRNDMYMLKSQMVPPICPACPNMSSDAYRPGDFNISDQKSDNNKKDNDRKNKDKDKNSKSWENYKNAGSGMNYNSNNNDNSNYSNIANNSRGGGNLGNGPQPPVGFDLMSLGNPTDLPRPTLSSFSAFGK